MNIPPRNKVQPWLFHVAFAVVPGTNGETLAQLKLPFRSGTIPTMNIGTITKSPMTFCVLAVDRIPLCWMAKTMSMMTAPMKNMALIDTAGNNGGLKLNSDHEWTAGMALAVTAAIASAASLPALAGSASQLTTSGDCSLNTGTGAIAFRM